MMTVDDRIDKIDYRIERLLDITEKNVHQIEAVIKTIEGLAKEQLELTKILQANRTEFLEFRATTGAALERIDRVLDYLLKQEGNRSKDLPEE